MSYDIYGNPLMRGHCEVHPHVHEEYPCSVCISERRVSQARTRNAPGLSTNSRASESRAEIERLRADAERYRELRRLATAWPQTVLVVNINIGHDWRTADAPEEIDSVVDAAIDAARESKP